MYIIPLNKVVNAVRTNPERAVFATILVALFFIGIGVMADYPEGFTNWLGSLLGIVDGGKDGKHEVLTSIGWCIAGVMSIWLAVSANKRANALDATARSAENGLRQDRMKNAIEHLGSKTSTIRKGGACELFYLAKDNESDRDFVQSLLDILCGHIREITGGKKYQDKYKTKPSDEIQSLLTILFVQKHDVFEGSSINLNHSHLNGASLCGAQLKNAILAGAHLRGAILPDTNLQGAYMCQAHLQGAILHNANLQGSNLEDAQMHGVFLLDAKLQAACLLRTQLQGAVLNYANMKGVQSKEHIVEWDFVTQIACGTDRPTDLSGITFFGGVQQPHFEEMCDCLPDGTAMKEDFVKKLKDQVGQPASNELPSDSEAITEPPYTEDEADQMHEEYEKHTRKKRNS